MTIFCLFCKLFKKGVLMMNKSRFCAIVIVAFFFVLGVVSAQAADGTVYKELSYQQLYNIMQDAGYEVNLHSDLRDNIVRFSEDETIAWEINDDVALINVNNEGRRVEFYIYITSNRRNVLDSVNEWNKDHFYSRSHVDEDGDPVLELELDTTGGITEARIKDFFKTCQSSFNQWRDSITD
jgi:hypothetical protein